MRTKRIIKDYRLSNLLDELESGLKQIYGHSLKKIILYGSYAKEQQEQGSDLDIMVLLEMEDKAIKKYDEAVLELTVDLTTRYGIYVSVVKNNAKFFDEWADVLPYFKNVKTEGINLYG